MKGQFERVENAHTRSRIACLDVMDMTKDAEMLQQMRKTFMLKQMREYLKRETERLKQETEDLKKAYEDAGLKFPDAE